MIKENQIIKQRVIFRHIEKFKSSIKNNYCLFCRTQINNNHFCKFLEKLEDTLVKKYFELDKEYRKSIIEELNDVSIKNQEFVQSIKNKILAYSL